MKKMLIWVLALMLLCSSNVSSLKEPMPIAVKVVAVYQDNIDVSVTNLRTAEAMYGKTNILGEIIFDWGNSVNGFQEGDRFRITVAGADDKTLAYDGIPFSVITFNLIPADCPKCPTVSEQLPYFCPEIGELCSEELYRICAYLDETPYDYENCKSLIACPECPDVTINYVITLIAGAILAAGAGSGIKIYRKRSGDAAILHKHVGIRSYHSPNVSHMNPLYRHKRGEMTPKLPNKL